MKSLSLVELLLEENPKEKAGEVKKITFTKADWEAAEKYGKLRINKGVKKKHRKNVLKPDLIAEFLMALYLGIKEPNGDNKTWDITHNDKKYEVKLLKGLKSDARLGTLGKANLQRNLGHIKLRKFIDKLFLGENSVLMMLQKDPAWRDIPEIASNRSLRRILQIIWNMNYIPWMKYKAWSDKAEDQPLKEELKSSLITRILAGEIGSGIIKLFKDLVSEIFKEWRQAINPISNKPPVNNQKNIKVNNSENEKYNHRFEQYPKNSIVGRTHKGMRDNLSTNKKYTKVLGEILNNISLDLNSIEFTPGWYSESDEIKLFDINWSEYHSGEITFAIVIYDHGGDGAKEGHILIGSPNDILMSKTITQGAQKVNINWDAIEMVAGVMESSMYQSYCDKKGKQTELLNLEDKKIMTEGFMKNFLIDIEEYIVEILQVNDNSASYDELEYEFKFKFPGEDIESLIEVLALLEDEEVIETDGSGEYFLIDEYFVG